MFIKMKKLLSVLMTGLMLVGMGQIPVVAAEESAVSYPPIVISQVYGGGGNSGADYKSDYVELYNPTDESVDLEGYTISYYSSKGNLGGTHTISGSIGPKSYFLIKEKDGNGGTLDLPTPDYDASKLAMSATKGSVQLSAPVQLDQKVGPQVDLVGFGSATLFEGSGPAPGLSNTTAAQRINNIDTDENSTDFEAIAPNPRNSTGSTPPVVEEKCATPTSDIPSGEVEADTVVTFSSSTADAAISYNTNSTTADEADWVVGATVTITAATTFYVRATKDGITASDVATFAYTIKAETPPGEDPVPSDGIVSITQAKALPDGTTGVKVQGIVTAVNGKNVYIQDSVDAICLYLNATATTVKAGDEIIVTGDRADYNALIELKNIDEASISIISSGNSIPNSGVVSIADIGEVVNGIAAYNYMSEMLEIESVVYTSDSLLTQGEDTIKIHPAADESNFDGISYGDTVNVSVRAYVYKTTPEVEIYSMTLVSAATPDPVDPGTGDDGGNSTTVYTIKDVLGMESGTTDITVEGQIVYFATSYSNPVIGAVIDGKTYGLYLFGASIDGAKVGDVVRVTGTYSPYGGLPELASILSSEIISTTETPIVPLEVTIQDILNSATTPIDSGDTLINRFVKIKDVTLGAYNASGNTVLTDATGTINIYKGTSFPALVEAGDVVDLYAIVAIHNSTLQMYTGTPEANGFPIYDIVNDTKAPIITLRDSYLEAKVGQDYEIGAAVGDNKGLDTVKVNVTLGGLTTSYDMTYNSDTLEYVYTLPGSMITSEMTDFSFDIRAKDITGLSTTSESVQVMVNNMPQITTVLPARNSSTGDEVSPLISVGLENSGDSPVVTLLLKRNATLLLENVAMEASIDGKTYSYQATDLAQGTYTATVTVVRADEASTSVKWTFTVGQAQYTAYFGQLHAHTAEYSDGSGTLKNGLDYLAAISPSDNVDFVSFTDHSNYFDTKTAANPATAMNDKSLMTAASLAKWNTYKSDIADFNSINTSSKLALGGFEMTWSGGPGHINTFNSDGLVSRNNTDLNNKSGDVGLIAYYDTLAADTDPLANLSQFNHPGTTFGTFSDFSYWNAVYDNKMVAVEVGNGEGAINSGGYFPSYSEYTKALDKGWHVAPTNNQDNHKGNWGNANTARTVIITDDFSETGLLTGLKNMSVYSTEDNNLNIQYTMNDLMMGSTIADVPSSALQVAINVVDEDINDTIAKIEVVTNSGRVVKSQSFSESAVEWNFELPAEQGYYYVRVTEADKNIAVTAPIWVGQAPLVGISGTEVSTKMPVTTESLTVTTTLFSNESETVTLKSVKYEVGSTVLKNETYNLSMTTGSIKTDALDYIPMSAGDVSILVTAVFEVGGQERIFSKTVDLEVRDLNQLVYVGIDASHYNEYVDGNYKDSMGNFANMAMDYDVRVVELKTSEELIAATAADSKFAMLVLTPPTRRNGTGFLIGYKNYSEDEIGAVKAFAQSGRTLILTGWGDNYESYDAYSDGTSYTLPASDHMSVQQNNILSAIGASLRLSDDEVKDNTNNGGSAQRLYLKNVNLENPFVMNVDPSAQVYSNYGGSTIYGVGSDGMPSDTLLNSVSPMVYGFSTTYSSDDDKDGTTGIADVAVPTYNDLYMVAASEEITHENGVKSTVIVAGSAFMSNFEIQASMDNYATPEYSNYTILQSIVESVEVEVISPIKEVHMADLGQSFTIIGVATSNASGYDQDTAFFDCIYVQDETAGINAFPVSGVVQAGQTVKITGKVSEYQGETQISVEEIEVIDATIQTLPEPKGGTVDAVTSASLLGSLVELSGTVESITESNGVVETIMVRDLEGDLGRVFIDGYITSTKEIENLEVGCQIKAVGLASIDTLGNRIRIRDRADLKCWKGEATVDISVVKAYETGTLAQVQGIVTYVSRKNVYVQDTTGAICLYLKANVVDLKVGDEIVASGKRANYSNLLELSNVYEEEIVILSRENEVPVMAPATIAELIAVVGEIAGYNHMCEIIAVNEVVLLDGSTLKQGEDTIIIYPSIQEEDLDGIVFGDTVNVVLRMYDYKGTLEVELISILPVVVPEPEVPGDNETPTPAANNGPTTYYTLTVTSTEGGSVPGFLGEGTYPAGTVVNLSVLADTGYVFDGWEGPVVGNVVTMTGDMTIHARFVVEETAIEETEALPEAGGASEEAKESETSETEDGNGQAEVTDGGLIGIEDELLPKTGGMPLGAYSSLGLILMSLGMALNKKRK